MKILFVTPLYPPQIGGPATYAKLLVDELPKRGHSVTLVKFSDFAWLPTGLRHLAIFGHVFWESFSHDMVFAQDVFSVGFPSALAAKLIGKKFIVRVPGDYAWEQGTQKFGITDSIDDFQKEKYSWRVELLRSIQKFVVRSADTVIAPSAYFANLVQGWLFTPSLSRGQDAKKVHAIYNGIDISRIQEFSKKTYQLATISYKLVSAGRLVPWKEFGSLIKIVAKNPLWKLTLIGDGPEKENLQNLAQVLGCTARVIFDKALPQEKLWETIAQADAFVLSSSFESFSYQAVEAMALGVPVVATNACNMEEIITNNENGMIVPVKNNEALESVLSQLFTNEALREKIGTTGARRAEDFSIDRTITNLIETLS